MMNKRSSLIASTLAAAAFLAGCTTHGGDSADTNPSAAVVGSIGIQTSDPVDPATAGVSMSPSIGPSTPATPIPTLDGSIHSDDIDTTVEDIAADQAAIEALCPEAAAWWKSVALVSLEQWRGTGMNVYASSFVLDAYTEKAFAALRSAGWTEFEVEALALPADDAGACIFFRPTTKESEVEAVILTFTALSPQPIPGTLDHQYGVTLGGAERRAKSLIAR